MQRGQECHLLVYVASRMGQVEEGFLAMMPAAGRPDHAGASVQREPLLEVTGSKPTQRGSGRRINDDIGTIRATLGLIYNSNTCM